MGNYNPTFRSLEEKNSPSTIKKICIFYLEGGGLMSVNPVELAYPVENPGGGVQGDGAGEEGGQDEEGTGKEY